MGSRPPLDPEGPHDELFDWQKIRQYIIFSLGSVRRRLWLFLLIAGGLVLLAGLALAGLPKTYEVETRLLTQKNNGLAVRADSDQGDQPTRAAAETIARSDNLHDLIQQTNLLEEWPKRRAPFARFKDWLTLKISGPPTQVEMVEGFIGLLRKNLEVWTTPDGTVTIRLRWPDGVMAYRLVDAAEQNFIEKRHVLEVSTIAEQLSILNGHATQLKENVEKQVAELQQLRQASAPKGVRQAPRLVPIKLADPEAASLRVMLDARRHAIADLEELRRRHLLEVQNRLAEQRTVYSESHPVVLDLEQTIASLQSESPQLAALRREEAELQAKLAKHGENADGASTSMPTIPPELFRTDLTEDSSVEYARAQLRFAMQQYSAMRERIDAARIDLDTAQAAFKYRYSVVLPPEIPRGPIKPKTPLVMIASVIVGLLLALFATTAADLHGGALLDTWQLQSLLGPGKAIVEVHFP